MPSSRHAMMMRIAISPRLAIRIFLNIAARFDREQPLSVLHGLPVLDVHTHDFTVVLRERAARAVRRAVVDRKSTRLNSSHRCSSYAVFCLKKKKTRLVTGEKIV